MKKYMLADLKLDIQPRESKVYIPSWHQHPDLSQLKKSLKRRLKTQLLHFEVVTGGITLGGLPIGTDGFHASQLRAKVSTLNEELSKLGLVQHGFMFKTLVRASHLQKLRFFLQGSSPFLPRVQSQIRRFDLSVHLALEKYHRCFRIVGEGTSSRPLRVYTPLFTIRLSLASSLGRPPASVVHIPGLRALVDSSHEHFIPPPAQRNVTPLVMRVFPRHVHARAALTDQQRESQDRVLQSTIFAHFPERDLSHSPMRVSSYNPLKAFPHRYAQMLDCYLHGMPICQCPTECDGCQRALDPSVAAHHLQTCKRRSSKLPTAHDNLTRTIRSMLNEAGLQSVIDTVGDPRSRRQVPSHPHGRKMKGDIHIPGIRDRGSEQYEGLMADVTLVHPYIGSSADLTKWGEVNLDALHVAASEKIRKHRAAYAMTTPPRAFIPLAISTDGTLHPDTLRFIWYLADINAQHSMPLEDAAFGRHFVPDDGPAAEVLARKRAATYQRLTMQLTLEALLSGARRMTPLRAQALLEPEDSSSSDFVESPEGESSPEVSDSDGGNTSSGADDRRGAGEASPSLTVTSGASGELDTTGAACLRGFALGLAMPRLGASSAVNLLQHGFMFKTLVRASHLQKLRFFLQGPARRMTPLRAQALLEPEDSSSSDFVESPEESSPEVSDSDGGNTWSGADDRRGAGEASPSLTVTSGASGELDTTGVLAAGPSSPASSPASVGSRRSLGIAAASPPSRAATTDSATADSEASEEDYLERYRVPVSSLPPSAAPGGPPGNAGSLSAAALSPSAAARFVAAADVSTDSGQSAASGYRV
ncbi:hypothetical protein GUITHDRAFT_122356 [Guillardia theta CCMP2712]|uniref:Uncharacterized protein n=1 Tax=Guillardia theta (strain CCMP2712) TaxID=905079 RepID=L1I5A5_GUITC|nr:hypothetical protein GUITHDRAFT_122356 [Guillardia theta CCMP2712]EKX31448.1 hypothetical protein GUITHDRAFT_122356 [Guillardia theta CCMP2712]|eukprot:XP_005818428.1 hypothetical protein GUITHDRAFT_122356 [Guillardia theta CCMP2712]